jgi:hypothetical protein
MSAVVEVVSDAFEAVGDAVGAVGEFIVDAAEEVGEFVVETAEAVGKTVEAIIEDPAKALPLIAVAVAAPYVAPYLWAGASTASAAMVLNTGIALAQGADPINIAQNLATSYVTQGLTANLPVDLSTGYSIADQAINNAANAAIQGRDISEAVGSGIGGSIIGSAVGAGTRAVKGMDFSNPNSGDVEAQDGGYYGGAAPSPTAVADVSLDNDAITTSETFRDAIYNGFSPEEAYAIAQGEMDARNSGSSPYAPTASNISSDQPDATVKVEGAPDDVEGEGVSLPQQTKEQLDQDLADGYITQEEYDRDVVNATGISKSEEEYVDPMEGALDILSPSDDTAPVDESSPIDGVEATDDPLGTTRDERGNLLYTYDDGSTLTVSADGEVVDVTEATDMGEYTDDYQEVEDGEGLEGEGEGEGEGEEGGEPTAKKGSGFSLKFGSGNKGRISGAGLARRNLVKSPTSAGTTSSAGGLDSLGGGQYGVGLTSGVTKGNTDYSLLGEEEAEEPQAFAKGGSSSSATQGVYDLSTTAASPFLGGGNSDIMALKPGTVKGKINYALPGYPFGQEWKAAKAGGSIQNAPEGHNPQFFSEGGLGSMKNTYVKGKGDGTSDSIAAMLANGEFVIPADVVSSLGNGSNDAGAKVLDEFLRTIRAHKRKANPKSLPPDSKGALGYLATAKKKVKK